MSYHHQGTLLKIIAEYTPYSTRISCLQYTIERKQSVLIQPLCSSADVCIYHVHAQQRRHWRQLLGDFSRLAKVLNPTSHTQFEYLKLLSRAETQFMAPFTTVQTVYKSI